MFTCQWRNMRGLVVNNTRRYCSVIISVIRRYYCVIISVTSLIVIYHTLRCNSNVKLSTVIKERNNLSNKLNGIMKVYGQQYCESLKMKQEDPRVSERGGWCRSMSSPDSKEHKWDKGFSQALSSFLKGKSVVSFGEGPGAYKKHLESLGEVKNYTAFDGAPYIEDVTEGRVKFLDLTCPQYGLPLFDWGVSVEVGEHIPQQYEDIYVDNLVRHVKEGLILSWAGPGQGGLSHVNLKTFDDVVSMMSKNGFSLDIQAGDNLRNASTFYWLKNNVQVYCRISRHSLNEFNA